LRTRSGALPLIEVYSVALAHLQRGSSRHPDFRLVVISRCGVRPASRSRKPPPAPDHRQPHLGNFSAGRPLGTAGSSRSGANTLYVRGPRMRSDRTKLLGPHHHPGPGRAAPPAPDWPPFGPRTHSPPRQVERKRNTREQVHPRVLVFGSPAGLGTKKRTRGKPNSPNGSLLQNRVLSPAVAVGQSQAEGRPGVGTRRRVRVWTVPLRMGHKKQRIEKTHGDAVREWRPRRTMVGWSGVPPAHGRDGTVMVALDRRRKPRSTAPATWCCTGSAYKVPMIAPRFLPQSTRVVRSAGSVSRAPTHRSVS